MHSNDHHAPGIATPHSARSWRSRLFRIWLAGALPWLLLVAAATIHDHQRAIDRVVAAAQAGAATDWPRMAPAALHAMRWLGAAIDYCGGAFATYGLLPALVTLFLYVLFLPWASQWPGRGTIED